VEIDVIEGRAAPAALAFAVGQPREIEGIGPIEERQPVLEIKAFAAVEFVLDLDQAVWGGAHAWRGHSSGRG